MPGESASTGYATVKRVKARHTEELMGLKNVVGVGIGKKEAGAGTAEIWVIMVYVEKKIALSQLDPKDCVPSELEGVPTAVVEIDKPMPYPGK
jgi:hypothetical protein